MLNEKGGEQETEILCLHCGTPSGKSKYCCSGCERVYALLHDSDLDSFYHFRNEVDIAAARPALENIPAYEYLDDPDFQEQYVKRVDDGTSRVDFYIEGVHCAACIWLLEHLPKISPGVMSAVLEFQAARLEVVFLTESRLSEIARAICELGYEPRPVKEDETSRQFDQHTLQLLYRLGVAAVSAGNCMMIAVSLYQGQYSGIEAKYESYFVWISAFLALPAVSYSAWPFYRAAYRGLKVGFLHVDLPISIGILLGYFLSLISAFQESSQVYFDSIAILIFLMLGGRLLQQAALKQSMNAQRSLHGLLPQSAVCLRNGIEEEVYLGSLKKGDVVIVRAGESLPADGELLSDIATIDMSILSGESEPVQFRKGDGVFASARNLSEDIQVCLTKSANESRVHRFFDESARSSRAKRYGEEQVQRTEQLIDVVSKYFVLAVLFFGISGCLYWSVISDVARALEIMMAFFVVSCPCALGLAAPLLLAKAIADSAKRGILITDSASFEFSARAQNICFDKTGTLTHRETNSTGLWRFSDQMKWQVMAELPEAEASMLFQLEKGIVHPVAAALRRHCSRASFEAIDWERKIEQNGIRGQWLSEQESKTIAIGNAHFVSESCPQVQLAIQQFETLQSPVFFWSGTTLWCFELQEKLMSHVGELMHEMREKEKTVAILSGDTRQAVQSIARQLKVDDWHSELSPEEKKDFIQKLEGESIMVGDGGNDAPALSAARVGIGISGGMEQVLQVASVFISSGDIPTLIDFLRASKKLTFLFSAAFVFALTYNLLAGSAALMGYISPLFAAVLMPLSSLSVILFAIWSSPYGRSK